MATWPQGPAGLLALNRSKTARREALRLKASARLAKERWGSEVLKISAVTRLRP